MIEDIQFVLKVAEKFEKSQNLTKDSNFST